MNEADEFAVSIAGVAITQDEVIRFLSEVAPSNKCPLCAHSLWSLITTSSPGVYPQIVAGSASGNLSQHLPTYLTTCSKCGYIRQHSYGPVLTWLGHQEERRDE